MELSKAERTALDLIAVSDDPEKLRNWIQNARSRSSKAVERAAFQKLCGIQPDALQGSLEHDVWRSIYALEEMLKEERGKTVLLSRTRQKIKKDGEAQTVADLTLKDKPSDGFAKLVEREHPELLFEAVVLRHSHLFEQRVIEAAKLRLKTNNIDVQSVT